jgi:iron complex outermembrane receptor protein
MHTRVSDTNQGLSLQADWSLGGHQVTSITAVRKWKNEQFQDQDRLAALYRQFNRIADRGTLDFEQTSQELRIASTQRGFFDYVAGLFYIQGENTEQYRRDVTRCAASVAPALPSGLVPCTAATTTSDNGVADYGVRSKSTSLFGEGTFNFTPALRAIAGLRYTSDELSYHHGRVASAAGVPGVGATRAPVTGSPPKRGFRALRSAVRDQQGHDGLRHRVARLQGAGLQRVLQHEPDTGQRDRTGEEQVDRGRGQVGVHEQPRAAQRRCVPDRLLGLPGQRAGPGQRRHRHPAHQRRRRDDQRSRGRPHRTRAAAADADRRCRHILARVDNFACPPGAAASCDINGRRLPFSPDWKASLRAKYTLPLSGDLSMDFGADANWQSETNFDLQQQPDSVQPAYGIVNATISLQSTKGWRVALLAKNLFDQSYATFIQNSGNHINRYVPRDDKRYFGVNVRYDF